MRSDIFYFMRKAPVDLMRYLPRFLEKDVEFAEAQKILSREHENYRLKLVDVAKQFFAQTATWGLSSWEDFLAINPAADSDLELRRANVKAKLLGQATMTVAQTNRLINQYTSDGLSYIVEKTGMPNVVKIEIPDPFVHFKDMRRMLLELLPAHLKDKYVFRVEDLFSDEGQNIFDEDSSKILMPYEDDYPYWKLHYRNGEFIHNGEITRGGSRLDTDELRFTLGFKFFDDFSQGFFNRDGKILRDGNVLHGLNVLPADFEFFSPITQRLEDREKTTDSFGNPRLFFSLSDTYRYGTNFNFTRDGKYNHEAEVFHGNRRDLEHDYLLGKVETVIEDKVKVEEEKFSEVEIGLKDNSPPSIDKSGKVEIYFHNLHNGEIHRDGSHERGLKYFCEDNLHGILSIRTLKRSGEFIRDGSIERTAEGRGIYETGV